MRIFREVFGSQGEVNAADQSSVAYDEISESPHDTMNEQNPNSPVLDISDSLFGDTEIGGSIETIPTTTQCDVSGPLTGEEPPTAQCNANGLSVDRDPPKAHSDGSSVDGKPSTSRGENRTLDGQRLNIQCGDTQTAKENDSMKIPKQKINVPYVHLKLHLKLDNIGGTSDIATNKKAREPLRAVPVDQQNGRQIERPTRNIKPVHRLNYGIVECCVCKKKIHVSDSTFNGDDGDILCSIKCFKNA